MLKESSSSVIPSGVNRLQSRRFAESRDLTPTARPRGKGS